MPTEIILPKVDMDMESGRISRWFVAEGDQVKKGDVLFEIETDKAAMEVDAPVAGTLRDVVGKVDVAIPVGEVVAWIFAEGEAYAPPAAADTAEPAAQAPVARPAPDAVASGQPDRREEAGAAATDGRIRATPLARRLARQNNVDLAALSGSGPQGRIQRKDVEAADAAAGDERPRPVCKAPSAAPAPAAEAVRTSEPATRRGGRTAGPLNAVWLREGSGVPVVLLHGFGADLNGWRPFVSGSALAGPVLALDLPGHGGSTRDVPESLEAIAQAVEATLEASGAPSFVLVGHSFGAAVAATLAARAMANVRGLALIAPAGLGPQINGAFLDGFVRARSEASLRPWMAELATDASVLTPAFVAMTLKQAGDEALRASQARLAGRFMPDGTQAIDIRPALKALPIPTRVIFGADDRIIPASHAHGLPGEIGVHVFSGCGHLPQFERRDQVMRIVAELAKLAA